MKDLKKLVYEWPTKHKEGFTYNEQLDIISYMGCDKETYLDKLGINTCIVIDGETITYHCDILTALRCTLENRDKYLYEWD